MNNKSYKFRDINDIYHEYSEYWIGNPIPTLQNPLSGINEFYKQIPALKTILNHIEKRTTPHINDSITSEITHSRIQPLAVYNAKFTNKATKNELIYATQHLKKKDYKSLSLKYTQRFYPVGRENSFDEDRDGHLSEYLESIYGFIEEYDDQNIYIEHDNAENFKTHWDTCYASYYPKNLTEHEIIQWMYDVKTHGAPEPLKDRNHIWNSLYGFNLIQDCITWIFQNIALTDGERFQKPETIGPLFEIFLNPESMLSLLDNLNTLNKERNNEHQTLFA